MKLYKVQIENPTKNKITLSILGNNKTFKRDEVVKESLFTKNYSKYFLEIGEKKGLGINLAETKIILNDKKTKDNSKTKDDIKKENYSKEYFDKNFEEVKIETDVKDEVKDEVKEAEKPKVKKRGRPPKKTEN